MEEIVHVGCHYAIKGHSMSLILIPIEVVRLQISE